MKFKALLLAVAVCGSMAADAQNYKKGNPNDSRYDYLQHYLPLKQYVDREQYPNFRVGLAIGAQDYVNGGTVRNVTNQYFMETVAGNAMKMGSCVRGDGSMDFTLVKNFVNKATASGINVYGHTLAWHSQQATGWLNGLIKDKKPETVEGNATAWVSVAEKDFAKSQSIGWSADKNQYGFSTSFSGDGLKVTTTKKTSQNYEVQYIAMDNIPTEKDVTYKMTMRIKGSKAGQLTAKLGDWGGGPTATVKFTSEWQDVTVNFKSTVVNSFLLLQHGHYVGDLWIKDVKFEQAISCNEVTEERRCIVMKTTPKTSEVWDNQFWFVLGKFAKGAKYEFSAEVRAEKPAKATTQIHNAPTSYVTFNAIGDINFSTEWKTVKASGTFSDAGQSIALNMSELADANTYYFDNISFKVNGVEKIKNGNLEGDDISSFKWKTAGGGAEDITITDGITYLQIPAPTPLSPQEKHDTLVYAMDRWIGGMMNACGGKVKAWDVVNEAISGGGADSEGVYALQHDNGSGDFFWQDHMGDLEYVRQAVRLAREHYAKSMEKQGGDDGQLKLFVNDYNLESDWDGNGKLKSLIKWIERWEADGVTKIDGIGSQMHISCYMNSSTQASKKRAIENSFKLMAKSGKLVRISELDMGVDDVNGNPVPTDKVTEAMHQKMADLYEWIVKKYLEIIPVEQQWGICQWCATDSPSNSGWRANTPVGLWTLDWYRKHTYAGFARGLGAPDNPTSIEEVEEETAEAEVQGPVYDLMGRCVGNSLKDLPAGLYIVNGKKILKK